MQERKGYAILSSIFLGMILIASCTNFPIQSAGVDQSYLTPIPESTILAYREGTPIADERQAVIAARAMVSSSRMQPVQPPEVLLVERMTMAEFQEKTGKPIDTSEAESPVWLVIFKGIWRGSSPQSAEETVTAPLPEFEGCLYVRMGERNGTGSVMGNITCPSKPQDRVTEEIDFIQQELANEKLDPEARASLEKRLVYLQKEATLVENAKKVTPPTTES